MQARMPFRWGSIIPLLLHASSHFIHAPHFPPSFLWDALVVPDICQVLPLQATLTTSLTHILLVWFGMVWYGMGDRSGKGCKFASPTRSVRIIVSPPKHLSLCHLSMYHTIIPVTSTYYTIPVTSGIHSPCLWWCCCCCRPCASKMR